MRHNKRFGGAPTNVVIKAEEEQIAMAINQGKLEVEKTHKELIGVRTELKNKSQELIRANKDIDKAKKDIASANESLVGIRGQIASQGQILSNLKDRINDAGFVMAQLDKSTREIERIRAEKELTLKDKKYLEQRIVDGLKTEEDILSRIKRSQTNMDARTKMLTELDNAIVSRKKQILDINNEIEQKKRIETEDRKKRIVEWERKEDEIKARISSIDTEITKSRAELKSLEDSKQKRFALIDKKEAELIAKEESLTQREIGFKGHENQVNAVAKTLQKHLDKLKIPIKVI